MWLTEFNKDDLNRIKQILNNPLSSKKDLRSADLTLESLMIDLKEKSEGKTKIYSERLRDGDL